MADDHISTGWSARFSVADLYSGAGGMSFGFHAHKSFRIVGAADAQLGKPSSRAGSLGCNSTFRNNIGIDPIDVDLGVVDPYHLLELWGREPGEIEVLSACPPCTGFSRATSQNHVRDDPRNSLVGRVGMFVAAIRPKVLVLENARELVNGRQAHHLEKLTADLCELGYRVHSAVHMLNRFGLPQRRERALLIAVKEPFQMRTLEDLWSGYSVRPTAVTVRRTIGHLPPLGAGVAARDDPAHVSPRFRSDVTLRRVQAIPRDGGSWIDLLGNPRTEVYLNPAQHRIIALGRIGSHPDVYGRMWWDEPARTLKRECSHVGNGRYSHPEQDRLCTVREMALLQGFPKSYRFDLSSLANAYRHIGDAVPPLVAYQLAGVVDWILSGERPELAQLCLTGTSLSPGDIFPTDVREKVA